MAKTPTNHGKQWTTRDVAYLQQLNRKNTPTRVMGIKHQRTEDAVRDEAAEIHLPLKPVNQSPYNRQKK